jgi:hypothetical protein
MKTHSYPAWFYGPHGQSQVFHNEADVPEGWQDHPSKVITPERTGSKPLPPTTDKVPADQRGAAPVIAANNATGQQTGGKGIDTGDQSNTLDAHGHPWSAELHAKSQSKTKDGLWRMKVGVSRPAPRAGFPKQAQPLDL